MTLTNENMLWQLIDFDKVLAESSGHPNYEILGPVPGAVESMKELHRRGWKLVIYTARPWADYQKIESWCETHQIPVRRIICGKVLGMWLLDDRAIPFRPDTPLESWGKALDTMGYPPSSNP